MTEVHVLYSYICPVQLDKMFREDNNYETRYLCNCDHDQTRKYFIKSDAYAFRVCPKHLPAASNFVNAEIFEHELNDERAEKFQQKVREQLELEYERAPKCKCTGQVPLLWSLPDRVWCEKCGLYSTVKIPTKLTGEEVTIEFIKSKRKFV